MNGMTPYIIMIAIIVIASAAWRLSTDWRKERALRKEIEGTLEGLRHRFKVEEERRILQTSRHDLSRAKFGNAPPLVLFCIGLILAICFGYAATTALGVYGWIFKGLGWSAESATSFAVVPFMMVFVLAFVLKLFIWPVAKSFLWGDTVHNLFGHVVSALVVLVIFTGVVFQLSPLASLRSELVMGRQVAQAQEGLAAVEAECAVDPAPEDCDALLEASEREVASAQVQLEKGKQVDETMAKIVPFAEMLTSFGPILIIEIVALVFLPFLRMHSAEKEARRLSLAILREEKKPEYLVQKQEREREEAERRETAMRQEAERREESLRLASERRREARRLKQEARAAKSEARAEEAAPTPPDEPEEGPVAAA